MAKNRKINLHAKPATDKPAATTPILGAAAAASADAGRSNVAAPTGAAKPGKAAKPAVATVPLIDRVSHRDAQYLARASYPAGSFTGTNAAYLGLFASFAKAAKNGVANVSAITVNGAKPAGISIVNNRARLRLLVLSGHCVYTDAVGAPTIGPSLDFRISDSAKSLAVYTQAVART